MTIGQRITELRTELKLSRSEVAASCGVRDVTVGNWERDINAPLGKNLVALAKKLKSTTEWIATGHGSKNPATTKLKATQGMLLPIITLSTAKNWHPNKLTIIGEATAWRNTIANISDHSFVIQPEGDAVLSTNNHPPIAPNAFIIIDPNEKPIDGSIVLVALDGNDKATLKRLVIDGPHQYLKSLNSDYKTIEFDKTCTIIGKAKRIEYDT